MPGFATFHRAGPAISRYAQRAPKPYWSGGFAQGRRARDADLDSKTGCRNLLVLNSCTFSKPSEVRSFVPDRVPVVNQFCFNSLWFWPKVCLELVFNKMLTIHEKL